MSDWQPMPKPDGSEKDRPDGETHEVRKRNLPGNAMGPDTSQGKPKQPSGPV